MRRVDPAGWPALARRSIMLAQCVALGHRWRPSQSLPGYQTCERCRLRRIPIS